MVYVQISPLPIDVLGGECQKSVQSHQCKIWGNQHMGFHRWPHFFDGGGAPSSSYKRTMLSGQGCQSEEAASLAVKLN